MNNPRLRNRLLWLIIGMGGALVLFYTLLLSYYFYLGLEMSNRLTLEQDAKYYAARYGESPDTPLPAGANLRSYRGIDSVPAPLLALFPPDSHVHRQMQKFDGTGEKNIPAGHPTEQLTELCNGVTCKLIFFYTYQLDETEWLYLVRSLGLKDVDAVQVAEFDRIVFITIPIASIFLLIIIIQSYLVIKRVGKPIRQLADWADSLTFDDLDSTLPNFRYRELDLVAGRLRGAFERIGQVMENEHRFLRNASHELRTPIAVMSANLELLDKLSVKYQRGESETNAVSRLQRAVLTMQQLTETLLWLSRESETPPASEPVALDMLVNSLIEENQYLLDDKKVEIEVINHFDKLNAPATPCRIVLTNLIRNAFQYTHEGKVTITIGEDSVEISNHCTNQKTGHPISKDYGFGLGLALVEQIAAKLGWHYQHINLDGGRLTTIGFNSCSSIE